MPTCSWHMMLMHIIAEESTYCSFSQFPVSYSQRRYILDSLSWSIISLKEERVNNRVRERDLQERMCVSIDVHFTGRWKWRGVWFVECKTNLINLAAFPCPTLWPVLLLIKKKSEGETYWNMLFKMPFKQMLEKKTKTNLSHNIKFNKCFAYI